MIKLSALTAALLVTLSTSAHAADWSDTSISARYGSSFAEPYDNNADGSRKDIKKGILALTHVSGYKYGTNFFNVDMLASDHNDPAGGVAGSSGAREVYAVYRHMLDLGKVSGKEFKFGPVRGVGVTAGFDFNTKNDGYASKKQMLVAGPTLMLDVPGFANVSALVFRESNAPGGISRYYYKTHGALELDWGIPIGSLPLSFNGYALYIGSKGQNEFGGSTQPETHVDMTLMYDASVVMGLPKHTALIGVEYEYWKNKFGNPVADAGPGAFAHTPMVRAEYHF
jgi:nucleoside-specific outer membrane channel protein Tsx